MKKVCKTKSTKKESAEQRYDGLHHQRVAENEFGMLSFLTYYLPLGLGSETNILTLYVSAFPPQKMVF